MSLPGGDARNTAALHFALNRLMQGQAAGMIGPGAGGAPLQWSQDPQTLLNQFHRFNPLIAQQIHRGAALNAPTPQPLPAPQANSQPHPQAAPVAAQGQNQGQQNQVKMTVTLPHHSPATGRLFQILMGGQHGMVGPGA